MLMLWLLACSTPVQPANGLAVLGMTPSHGQVGVALDTDITVVFSQPLDPETVGGVELMSGDVLVAATVFSDGSVITLRPADDLQTQTAYTVVLDPFIAGQDGTLLGSQVRGTFTTGNTWVEGDADTDTDTDTDTDVPEVQPPWMVIGGTVVVDDGLWGYSVDGAWTDPFVNVTFFETGPDDACEWYGWLSNDGKTVFPEETQVWSAYRLELESFDTDCIGFDPGVWSGETPSGHMNNVTMAIGWGPMSDEARARLRQDFEESGQDWTEYEPYFHSVWYAFDDGTGQWDAHEASYGLAHAVDDTYEVLEDADGSQILLEADRGDPGPAAYVSYAYQPLSTGLLFK